MIKYEEMEIGKKLEITGMGARGFAELGDVVTVTKTGNDRVYVQNEKGEEAYFALTCGSERLKEIH